MAVSIDQLPDDLPDTIDGRWRFHLSEPFQGHFGGAFFVDGVTTEGIGNHPFKRFVCGHGHVMVGAVRVSGGPECHIGDVSALVGELAEPAPEQTADVGAEVARGVFAESGSVEEELFSILPPEEDTDHETPRSKKGKR